MRRHNHHRILDHEAALLRYARALTRDVGAAEDLVQETLLAAHERYSELRSASSLRSWLFSVLHNRFVDGTRRRRSEEARIAAVAEMHATEQPANQELAAYLHQIAVRFDQLPEGQRAVLHLVAVEGLTYQEVATALSIPIGTVMSRLSRARSALREDVAEPDILTLRIKGSLYAD